MIPARWPDYERAMMMVLATWGQYCGDIIFTMMGEKPANADEYIRADADKGSFTPGRKLKARLIYLEEHLRPEDHENLVEKMMRSLLWVYENVSPLPDFILKADLDYFVIPQNLLKMLTKYR
eukprot:UN05378